VKLPHLALRSYSFAALIACLVLSCGGEPEQAGTDGSMQDPPGVEGSSEANSASPVNTNSKRIALSGEQTFRIWKGEWANREGTLIAAPSDLITNQEHGDYHLHLDFLIPEGSEGDVDSGIFLSDRWEVQIAHSAGEVPSAASSGAVFGVHAPMVDAALKAGQWQSMDIRYEHWAGESPHVSVWLNQQLVQDDVALDLPTEGGNPQPLPGLHTGDAGAWHLAADGTPAQITPWGESDWAVAARFRTEDNGTLVSRCAPMGEWAPDAKALFLRGGRLVYDIGWVGSLTSERQFNDGQWHTAVLRNQSGTAQLWVDGKLEAERENFQASDRPGFTFKVGAASHNFGGAYQGEIEQVRFFENGLDGETARKISAEPSGDLLSQSSATILWQADANAIQAASFERGDPLLGPIRLQGSSTEMQFKNIWLQPLEDVDHARMISELDEESFEQGRAIYNGTCSACHGHDGLVATNPQARPFASGVLENGTDPYRLYLTTRLGFRDMPASQWLSPEETYSVVHYLREHFLKERNASQYFEVQDEYLAGLPKGRLHAMETEAEPVERDFGPALTSQLGDKVGAALTVKLDGNTTFSYDLQTMASAGIWTGGFLSLGNTQHYQQRGEGKAQPHGKMLEMLKFAWGYGGTLDWDRKLRPPRGPLPQTMLDYGGYSLLQRKVALTYSINERLILDYLFAMQTEAGPAICHTIWADSDGPELVLQLAEIPSILGEGSFRSTLSDGTVAHSLHLQTGGLSDDVLVSYFPGSTGNSDQPELLVDEQNRVVLRIPESEDEMVFHIVCMQSPNQLAQLVVLSPEQIAAAENHLLTAYAIDANEEKYPSMWPQELITSGSLGDQKPYALDSLTLPASNPWNAWIRTSALDFFEDGRAAVSTYGGDVWIVSGIDEDLHQLKWRRFAAGLFEPMGVKVVDDQVYVTCRDRIVRLLDRDQNGEADFYESYFADPDVSTTFHAFNFDLQVDGVGNFYYAKSGQYTDFNLGGAVVQVAPNGRSHQIYATGLRTPNGMGMSSNGDPLVSDNQGNWIPASKISLVKEDGFYGVFPAINNGSPGRKTSDTFDQPVIWMPQNFDSSSGGQLWVDDERFGPLSGRYLHTSFGKGWMYPFQIDETTNPPQAAIWQLPYQFAAGIQRLRINPADGQVYTVGLSGWQGPDGGADGCLQRLRFVGGGDPILLAARSVATGVELEFSEPLDPAMAQAVDRFEVRRWNYLWSRNYGSDHYSVARPGEKGQDSVAVTGVALSDDGKRLTVHLETMVICNQLQLEYRLTSQSGTELKDRVLFTVNQIPGTASSRNDQAK
jgi:glucose/arabinose dehydrogenase